MKKFIFILSLFISYATDSLADVCYDITPDTASKAVQILQDQNKIYQYCSICSETKAKPIEITDIKNSNPLLINGQSIDLAHTYYEKDGKYFNLGVASGCIKNNQYGIKAELDSLSPIHNSPEKTLELTKIQLAKVIETCNAEAMKNMVSNTADMIYNAEQTNACLTEAIKTEIKKCFEPHEQSLMIEYLEQIQKGTSSFYQILNTQNKYCDSSCGSDFSLMAYADVGNILNQILEKLLYLNISKNEY
ncbi:MAG: hypothetical protein IJ689_05485 [Alphaproteobacteria bacterium]|nr:hypothetical protein [Alphaproteobacteria bacterium]